MTVCSQSGCSSVAARIFAWAVDRDTGNKAGELGIVPAEPLPYWGWGTIPDQYGRRWAEDDGEHNEPPNPRTSDLPPLHREWS